MAALQILVALCSIASIVPILFLIRWLKARLDRSRNRRAWDRLIRCMTGLGRRIGNSACPALETEWSCPMNPSRMLRLAVFCLAIWLPTTLAAEHACPGDDRVLDFGFYAFFAPVSHNMGDDPKTVEFNIHLGYEADLLSALEDMEGVGLSFSRRAITVWDDIWLQAASPQYDMVGGGITILDARTRDAEGKQVVMFTSGHIAFRQSFLVRSEDADRLARYEDLTSDVRVGVLAGTTGEARLLALTGLVDADGVLVAGMRVDTPGGTAVADGSSRYVITAAVESPQLAVRQRLHPPSESMPQVVYLGAVAGESELLDALRVGSIDAVARGTVGNTNAAQASDGAFVITAVDAVAEHGGFAVEDAALAMCLDEMIDWLTDSRRIGYREWRHDPWVFRQRAAMWNQGTR